MARIKENATGVPSTGTDTSQWQSALFGMASQFTGVLADNLRTQNQQTQARQPGGADVAPKWFEKPAVLIGGAVALVVLLVVVMRRR
jgi:hypothetical protein